MDMHLTRAFFEEELPKLTESFKAESGAQKTIAELLLRNGAHVRVESEATYSANYLSFDRKDGSNHSRMILPYGSILAVTIIADHDKKVGFGR